MLMGNSSCSSQNIENNQPKLENFLGGHSFSDHDQQKQLHGYESSTTGDYVFPFQTPSEAAEEAATTARGGGINVSMIKTWLRSQPENKDSGGSGGNLMNNANTLSLSMSTCSGGESSSSENKQQKAATAAGQLDSQTASVVEAVPRKSIDTFGQRTSIYRGVTRFIFERKFTLTSIK